MGERERGKVKIQPEQGIVFLSVLETAWPSPVQVGPSPACQHMSGYPFSNMSLSLQSPELRGQQNQQQNAAPERK